MTQVESPPVALPDPDATLVREEQPGDGTGTIAVFYWAIELAVLEKAVLELTPIIRMVPTTRTRITASTTAYSAIS